MGQNYITEYQKLIICIYVDNNLKSLKHLYWDAELLNIMWKAPDQ